MHKTILLAVTFAFVLAMGAVAPLGLTYNDGVQVVENTADAKVKKDK